MTRTPSLPSRFAIALAACLSALPALAQPAPERALPGFVKDISAGTIAAISDGDFVARSYADGRLAPEEAGFRDLLSVISIANGRVTQSAIPVSNSVTAAPEILALTPDGASAFVVERLGQRRSGQSLARELAAGTRLFAIDLGDKAAPKLAATVEVAGFPEALALAPDGATLAVVSNTAEASFIQLASFRDGAFGPVTRVDLKTLGIAGEAAGPRGGVTATNVQWHPSGRILAVNLNTQNRVVFLELTGEGESVALRRWGEPVATGRDPFVGRFTPDGKHYVTSNWGRNFGASDLAGRLPTGPSTLSVIRLAEAGTPAAEARHRVVASADSDRSAEGLAISPDGRLVATVNMRDTALPTDHPRFEREGSVSLLSLDPETGALTKIGDYAMEGALPEGGTFDLTGEHFLATVFHGHAGAGPENGAGLEVFKVRRDGRPGLDRLGRIPLPHGAHHVAVSR